MLDSDDKENFNHNYQTIKSIQEEFGCETLSESEDEEDEVAPPQNMATFEDFLNQAEKCLMDIEMLENDENTKMKLINRLAFYIQQQRQVKSVSKMFLPTGYSVPQYLTLAGLRTEVVGAPEENQRTRAPEEKKKGVTWAPQQQEEVESDAEDDTIIEKGNIFQLSDTDCTPRNLGLIFGSHETALLNTIIPPRSGYCTTFEDFLNQAEKCLMDIEMLENDENTKMKLINRLAFYIQQQRQVKSVSKMFLPTGYSVPQYLTLAGLRTEVVGAPEENQRTRAPEEKKKGVTWAPQQQEEVESDAEDDTIIEKGFSPPCSPDHPTPEPPPPPPPSGAGDDVIIPAPAKTYEQLLEEKLMEDQRLMPPPPAVKNKRPFLKRGQGIARTRYLGHVTGYQPIRDQYFVIRSVSGIN
eukprot:sb/3465192/